MRQFNYQYPKDPIDSCLVMSRAEFLLAFPRQPIEIYSEHEEMQSIPIGEDEICCDVCNEDPLDAIYVINKGTRALCKACADKYVIPYAT